MPNDLQRAHQLIKAGDKAAALDILAPICQTQPNNVDAWWLAANALNDPKQVYAALQRVLTIDPFHEGALRKLELLEGKKPPPKNQQSNWIVPTLLVLFILAGVVGGGLVILTNNGDDDDAVAVDPIPTDLVTIESDGESTPTNELSSTDEVAVVNTPTRATSGLPPTWTPIPSPTVFAGPTNTSWIQPTAIIATPNPAQFGETYWEGIGDGYTLDRFRLSSGRYLRFFDFPITVYVADPMDARWQAAADAAMVDISQVVPMELTTDSFDPDVIVHIMPPLEYERWSGCPAFQSLGCATILDLSMAGAYPRIKGEVWLNSDGFDPVGTFIHELLHAIGVWVHSPFESDIMHPVAIEGVTHMSQRDINTLRRLYANPSYVD